MFSHLAMYDILICITTVIIHNALRGSIYFLDKERGQWKNLGKQKKVLP